MPGLMQNSQSPQLLLETKKNLQMEGEQELLETKKNLLMEGEQEDKQSPQQASKEQSQQHDDHQYNETKRQFLMYKKFQRDFPGATVEDWRIFQSLSGSTVEVTEISSTTATTKYTSPCKKRN